MGTPSGRREARMVWQRLRIPFERLAEFMPEAVLLAAREIG
jgi:hypothetical protein